jgi:ABC-type multidrug transport system fused ATPase/permease subunit
MQADIILVLDQGMIIQKGTHEDLLSKPGKYQDIFNIQAKIDDALQKELKPSTHQT